MAKGSTMKFEAGTFPMSKFMDWGMKACLAMAFLCLVGTAELFFHPKLSRPFDWYITLFLFFGNLAVAFRCYQIRNDKIELDDEGVRRVGRNGTRSSLAWKEIAKIQDKNKMQQLILSNAAGTKRVVIDHQFNNFQDIRERIMMQLK